MADQPVSRCAVTVFAVLLTLVGVLDTCRAVDFDHLWNYSDPAGTRTRFQQVLEDSAGSLSPDERLQLKTQIARTWSLIGDSANAFEQLREVEAELTENTVIARIRFLLEKGRVYNSTGSADTAARYFHDAWDLALQSEQDFHTVDAAHMLALVEPPQQALGWSEEAIRIAEASDDPRVKGWLGPLYNNTGWIRHDMGDYEQALELFEKGMNWHAERQTGEGYYIARWTYARGLRSLNRVEEALTLQQALYQERVEQQLPPDGYNLEELGELHYLLGETDQAGEWFREAYRLLSQDDWLVTHEPDRLARLKKLGQERSGREE